MIRTDGIKAAATAASMALDAVRPITDALSRQVSSAHDVIDTAAREGTTFADTVHDRCGISAQNAGICLGETARTLKDATATLEEIIYALAYILREESK